MGFLSDIERVDYILDEGNPWDKRYRISQFFDNEDLIKVYIFQIRNVEIRLVFLRKIKDQNVLLRLARDDPDPTIRKLAIMGLKSSHHKEFKSIAEKDPLWFVRLAALEKLPQNYQSFFAKVLIEEEHDKVRRKARDNIRLNEIKPDMLFRLTIEAWDQIVRKAAFKYINSEEMFFQLAMKSADYTIAEQAIERIDNQELLRKIAISAEFGHIRAYASMKITDQRFLASLFLNDNSPFVREICLSKITTLTELIKLRLVARMDLQVNIINRIKELTNEKNNKG